MQANQQKLQEVIAKSWSDPAFKQQLIDSPTDVLKQQGIDLPEGKEIKVLVDDEHTQNLVIPQKPDQLSDEDLSNTAGGICCTQGCFC